MNTNTFFEQNKFFLERKERWVEQCLEKQEGWRFLGGVDRLAVILDELLNFKTSIKELHFD